MMDSLFEQYFIERQGIKTIIKEFGFVTYKISDEECFICDMFIQKEKRAIGLGRSLLYGVKAEALKRGCKFISANIHLADPGSENTLFAAKEVGFKVVSAHNNVLLISKDIKEDL